MGYISFGLFQVVGSLCVHLSHTSQLAFEAALEVPHSYCQIVVLLIIVADSAVQTTSLLAKKSTCLMHVGEALLYPAMFWSTVIIFAIAEMLKAGICHHCMSVV
jgi:hypothetical protein